MPLPRLTPNLFSRKALRLSRNPGWKDEVSSGRAFGRSTYETSHLWRIQPETGWKPIYSALRSVERSLNGIPHGLPAHLPRRRAGVL